MTQFKLKKSLVDLVEETVLRQLDLRCFSDPEFIRFANFVIPYSMSFLSIDEIASEYISQRKQSAI